MKRSHRRSLAVLAIVAGLLLVGAFSVRTWMQYTFAQRVARGEIQVETLRGWMTLPYIAQVYRVPESELRATLDLPTTGYDERSLLQWFDATGIEPKTGRARIETLILAKATQPKDARD
jgi:hypothetical protein